MNFINVTGLRFLGVQPLRQFTTPIIPPPSINKIKLSKRDQLYS